MSSEYKKLENDLNYLLESMISFTPSEVGEVQQFLSAGEYGLAFETICGIANEENKPFPLEILSKVRLLAEQMKIDPIWWAELTNKK